MDDGEDERIDSGVVVRVRKGIGGEGGEEGR